MVTITTPQFGRVDNAVISATPSSKEDFDNLRTLDESALRDLGMMSWGEHNLWLFPGEWYSSIPEEYPVTDIFGREQKFAKGITDNDIRFGCLAYGICKKK